MEIHLETSGTYKQINLCLFFTVSAKHVSLNCMVYSYLRMQIMTIVLYKIEKENLRSFYRFNLKNNIHLSWIEETAFIITETCYN